MTAPGTVGVVGLGLMGGSLARELAGAGWRVQGTDRDPVTERRAVESGVVGGPIEVDAVDVLVLAVPVRAAPGWLRRLAPRLRSDAIITDVGSTKRAVIEAAEAAGLARQFAGSHPMAGDHRSGWAAGRTGLFRAATVWICPTDSTAERTLSAVEGLWRALDAVPRRLDAAEHDRLLARSSHLPQLLASSLAAVLARAGIGAEELGAGGADMTRLAGSDPAMWADILVDNSDEVAPAVDDLIDALTRYRRALRDVDDATLRSLLAAGRAWSLGEADRETGAAGSHHL